MRINRFIALAGLTSRRDAETYVKDGRVKVNGNVISDLATKVDPIKDKITVDGKRVALKNYVYFLMNKPKNTITTTRDPEGRKTVMDLMQTVTDERVFPVGRLDRNTTGLLIFTNDGELAETLTHPSNNVKKLYHVKLDTDFVTDDLGVLREGIELEDGFIKADKVDYVENRPFNEVGIEIHSGRNRIVRRMFEHLGYKVIGLDRTSFGPLTKKLLPRGKVRHLTEKEVSFLKMIRPARKKRKPKSSGRNKTA